MALAVPVILCVILMAAAVFLTVSATPSDPYPNNQHVSTYPTPGR